jgi:hypothetical protein
MASAIMLSVIMFSVNLLSLIMLSVNMLSVNMLSVNMLSLIMLSVNTQWIYEVSLWSGIMLSVILLNDVTSLLRTSLTITVTLSPLPIF